MQSCPPPTLYATGPRSVDQHEPARKACLALGPGVQSRDLRCSAGFVEEVRCGCCRSGGVDGCFKAGFLRTVLLGSGLQRCVLSMPAQALEWHKSLLVEKVAETPTQHPISWRHCHRQGTGRRWNRRMSAMSLTRSMASRPSSPTRPQRRGGTYTASRGERGGVD